MAYNSKSQLTKKLSRQELKGEISLTNQSKRDLLSCRPGSKEGGKEGKTKAGRQAGHHMNCLLAGRLAYAHLALTVQDHSSRGWCCP